MLGFMQGTLTGHKQLTLFIFRRDCTTCRVHMRYVVPDVMGQLCPCAIFSHPLGHQVSLSSRTFISSADAASAFTPNRDHFAAPQTHARWAAASSLPIPTSDWGSPMRGLPAGR